MFLATDRARFVHGAILPVDGGRTAVLISSPSHLGATSASARSRHEQSAGCPLRARSGHSRREMHAA
jgi:hypothetical protein